MPEYPEVQGQKHVISKGKGSGLVHKTFSKLKVRSITHANNCFIQFRCSSLRNSSPFVFLWAQKNTVSSPFPPTGTTMTRMEHKRLTPILPF